MSEPLVTCPEFSHAFVGIVMRFGQDTPIACYDYDKVIAGYIADGMTADEADEYFEYNVLGAWVGGGTPCFIRRMSLEQAVEEEA